MKRKSPTPTVVSNAHPTAKSKKASVSRFLKTLQPQIVEGAKTSLLLKGNRCNETMTNVLRDLRALVAPEAKLLTKKNDIHPFDDATSIEFLANKNHCNTFAIGSVSKEKKKRNIACIA
jgi:hypothetical protein